MNLFIYSLFFSCVGLGFYMYGKKNNLYFLLSGLALMVFPYFVSTLLMMVIIGVLCIIAPFILNWLSPL